MCRRVRSVRILWCGSRITEMITIEDRERSECLRNAMSSLQDRERLVLERRFLGDKTLREIGIELGVSPERVRQIESKALRKLRHPSRLRHLEGFIENNPDFPEGKESQAQPVDPGRDLIESACYAAEELIAAQMQNFVRVAKEAGVKDLDEAFDRFKKRLSSFISLCHLVREISPHA